MAINLEAICLPLQRLNGPCFFFWPMLNSFGLLMFATSLLTHMVTIDTIDHIFCSFGRLLSVENGQMGGRSCLSLIVVASTTTCSFHLAWANMQEREIEKEQYMRTIIIFLSKPNKHS